jgi:hypothetical protein
MRQSMTTQQGKPALGVASSRKPPATGPRGKRSRGSGVLLLLAAPGIAWFLVFAYAPMAGLVVAFKNFSVSQGIFNSPWSGLDNLVSKCGMWTGSVATAAAGFAASSGDPSSNPQHSIFSSGAAGPGPVHRAP